MLKKNIQNESLHQKPFDIISITIPEELVRKLVSFFIFKKKKDILMNGFEKGAIPEFYIKEHYKSSLIFHIEKILLNFYIQDIIIQKLRFDGAHIPLFFSFEKNIDLESNKIIFTYQYSSKIFDKELIYDTKKLKFPERKRYKDLDRQAIMTISQEEKNKGLSERYIIQEGDWIGIKIYLVNEQFKIDECLNTKIWIHITSEGIDREIRKTFLEKKIGDSFLSNAFFLQELLSTDFLIHQFLIIIEDHISHVYFDFEKFEKTYVYEGQTVLEKMIDIFSLRNDISLKKEKSQYTLKYFLEKIKISLEPDIISEYELIIKNKIIKNSDYLLYQSDINFLSNIRKLACRQVMEKMLIDYLIYRYDIKISKDIIYSYLNILQRHRLKDFLCFDRYDFYDNTMKSVPIFHYVIEQMSLREKAIEYLIYKLS